MGSFKRKSRIQNLYEITFNNKPNVDFDRISATSKEEAKKKMKKLYPKDKITDCKRIS